MKKVSALILSLILVVGSVCASYADETAAQIFDAVALLLTGTENVTLTGNATFSLDGEVFKYVETSYVQDGVNSKWVLNLSSPKRDGGLLENGFTAIANNRNKYGMEVYRPGTYVAAEDDPQSVILRPSAELKQLISLGHHVLAQVPTLSEDEFSLSEGKHLTIRMEGEIIPDSLSNLLSLGMWLAVQRTINMADDSIAAPPYPEEAPTMEDYITPTLAIVDSTEKYELKQLYVDAEMDDEGRFTEANGTAVIVLHTFLEGVHELHISFSGQVSNYGTSVVEAFVPEEYGVEPAEGTWIPLEFGPVEGETEYERDTYLPLNGSFTELETELNGEQAYWINPDGGTKYHADRNCPSLNPRYLPLSVSLTVEELAVEPYSQLSPCHVCVFDIPLGNG